MAKRTRTTKTTRTTTTRTPRATSRRAPAAAPAPGTAEVVEERRGLGLDAGVAIVTTLLLLAAILFVDAFRGGYGEGIFF